MRVAAHALVAALLVASGVTSCIVIEAGTACESDPTLCCLKYPGLPACQKTDGGDPLPDARPDVPPESGQDAPGSDGDAPDGPPPPDARPDAPSDVRDAPAETFDGGPVCQPDPARRDGCEFALGPGTTGYGGTCGGRASETGPRDWTGCLYYPAGTPSGGPKTPTWCCCAPGNERLCD